MVQRDSINIGGFKHTNPIPNASRIGNIVASGLILGKHPETGELADTLEGQCALVFQHLKDTVEAAGGTTDNILKITVWLQDPSDRTVLNAEWTRMFPDPDSRPARQVLKDVSGGPNLVQCDFLAVL